MDQITASGIASVERAAPAVISEPGAGAMSAWADAVRQNAAMSTTSIAKPRRGIPSAIDARNRRDGEREDLCAS